MNTPLLTVEKLDDSAARRAIPELCEILRDCVDGGASVSFLSPLSRERAAAFWEKIASDVACGDRALFVARDGSGIQGTVQLILQMTENQPHRAEVAKLLVHRRARHRGIAEALMLAAQECAPSFGKSVLTLDTATPEAARLYERLGWQAAGTIPDYALNPDRTLCATTFYWKRVPG